ncbi:MAG: hypothetical protein IPN88_03125 [Bacteroidetes bacterium]|nr:hypothetical protein [Bacteroidota bacterium]
MNLLKGQIIEWTEKVFLDHGKNAIFCGERTNTGQIIKESYGDKRGQHTFTILIQASKGYQALSVGKNVCRKGRNVYRTAKIINDVDQKIKSELTIEKSKELLLQSRENTKNWIDEGKTSKLKKIPSGILKGNI